MPISLINTDLKIITRALAIASWIVLVPSCVGWPILSTSMLLIFFLICIFVIASMADI